MSKYEFAISLYSGEFLVEMYDLWCDDIRLIYKEKYIHALEKAASFYMKEKKHKKAVDYCKRIIAADEFRESAYLMAIKSFINIGNRKAAVGLYKRLKKILRDELGVEPSPEIEEMFLKISK